MTSTIDVDTLTNEKPAQINAAFEDTTYDEIVYRILNAHRTNTGSICIPKQQLLDSSLAKVFLAGKVDSVHKRMMAAATRQNGIKTLTIDGIEYCYLLDDLADEDWLLHYFDGVYWGKKSLNLDAKKVEKAAKNIGKKMGVRLTAAQLNAVKTALTSGMSVITGGPGCGKTFVVDVIIKTVQELKKDASIMLAAPTGMAARRLSEATHMPAHTIFKLLGVSYKGDLEHLTSKKVCADLIIIDETSMLDLQLACRLFNMVTPSTSIVFVGDADQLPSVKPGAVLRDFEQSGIIPVVRLENSYRQVSGAEEIISYAKAINNTDQTLILPFFRDTTLDNPVHFIPAGSVEEIQDKVLSTVKHLHGMGYSYDKIQVLSPTKDNAAGANALNEALSGMINPNRCVKQKFSLGDRVACTKNDYSSGVVNGEIGTVVGFEKRRVVVEVEGRNIPLPPSELMLAYALTVHRSQGGQYPIVVLALHHSMGRALSRAMLYTALTRAQEKVVVVGSGEAVIAAMSANRNAERFSVLAQRLKAEIPKAA